MNSKMRYLILGVIGTAGLLAVQSMDAGALTFSKKHDEMLVLQQQEISAATPETLAETYQVAGMLDATSSALDDAVADGIDAHVEPMDHDDHSSHQHNEHDPEEEFEAEMDESVEDYLVDEELPKDDMTEHSAE